MFVTELDDMGQPSKEHELPFKYSMMLPAFKGVERWPRSKACATRAASC